jgi:DNA-binding NtrC family response regulator
MSVIANGARMRAVAAFARWNADDRAPLLIVGEPGSGRQFIARTMHDASSRQFDGFACVAGTALSANRLRSELHRHATMVIAGIESLPEDTAVLLPRLIETAQGRVLATGTLTADRSAFEGNVIEVPPLRERREDIVPLTALFLGRPVSPPAVQALLDYAWPGNVRELRETCEWIARTCRCRIVKRGCLPARIPAEASGFDRRQIAHIDAEGLDERVARFEAGIIQSALEAARYNRSRAARLLGVKRSTLVDRIRRLGIGIEEEEMRCA